MLTKPCKDYRNPPSHTHSLILAVKTKQTILDHTDTIMHRLQVTTISHTAWAQQYRQNKPHITILRSVVSVPWPARQAVWFGQSKLFVRRWSESCRRMILFKSLERKGKLEFTLSYTAQIRPPKKSIKKITDDHTDTIMQILKDTTTSHTACVELQRY